MGCDLWTKAGSANQFARPEIGLVGTPVGGSYALGKFENGYLSDANGESVDYSFAPDMSNPGALSIWYKPNYNSSDAVQHEIIGYQTSADRLSLDFLSNNFRCIVPKSPSSVFVVSYAPTFSANDLLHLAMVWDNGGIDGGADTFRFYLNGVNVVSSTLALGSTTSQVRLGRAPINYNGGGVIDQFRRYNEAKINWNDRFQQRLGGAKRRIA